MSVGFYFLPGALVGFEWGGSREESAKSLELQTHFLKYQHLSGASACNGLRGQ